MKKISEKHRVLGRSIGGLDARDPSLVNLPLPVGSVPVVGALAKPLVGDSAGDSTQSSPPPNPQPAPASPGGGHGGPNGNGSGGGGGNGQGNGGGNGRGNGGGSGAAGGGGGGGSAPIPIVPPMNSGGTVPSPGIPSPLPSNLTPGTPPGSPSAKNSSGGAPSPSSLGANGNFLGAGQSAPVNVGSGTSPITFAAPGASTAAIVTGSLSQYSSSINTIGVAASMPTVTTLAAVSSGKRLSSGAVAGISLMCLLFLIALTLLVIRRRSIAHRLELRRQWWFNSGASARSFFNGGSSRSPVNAEAPASRLSARSSFATNFDQGLMFRIDSPTRLSLGLIPDLPPTAEVRERNSVLISTGGSVARRESMNSMLSNSSDPGAQYLTIPAGHNNPEPTTPMSVRPFSPSESFAFPKPPQPPSSTVDSFTFASPGIVSSQSSATLVHLNTPPRAFMTDLPPSKPQVSTPGIAVSPFIVADSPSVDPFMDPPKAEPSNVEIIRRPFAPSLDDEMAVVPGDRVRIIQVFDDGWAFVDKVAGTECERHERGLIPVDCFRNVDQALPTFLAEKRVSYGSRGPVGTAL